MALSLPGQDDLQCDDRHFFDRLGEVNPGCAPLKITMMAVGLLRYGTVYTALTKLPVNACCGRPGRVFWAEVV